MKIDCDESGGPVPATELLRREFPELKITCDRPYRELTTLGVGGALPVLAEPADAETLAKLLGFLKRRQIPFFILGGGSNLVGMDAPYPGVGIRLERAAFGTIRREGDTLVCGGRASLPEAAATAAKAGLHGMASLAGIPGSVGGAVRMNASCRGVSTGTLVAEVAGVTFDGKPWKARGADLKWEYRSGGVPDDVVITEVVLKLALGEVEAELAALEAERAKRRETEPAGRSAGCVFRNVSPEEPAGMLIDRCGLRGARIGGVEISAKHANYIVNASGNASEAEFLTLAKLARRSVLERFGRELKPEVRFISEASRQALIEESSPATGASSPAASPVLLALCRWLYRLVLVLAAASLAAVARSIWPTSRAAAGVLIAGAALLLISETVYSILKYLEKR